jgi:hypothetical protein
VSLTVNDVIAVCRRKNVSIDLINLSVGTIIIDKTGVIGRGSAATLLDGVTPRIEPDEVIVEAAQTFVINRANGEKSLLDREEFEEFCRREQE